MCGFEHLKRNAVSMYLEILDSESYKWIVIVSWNWNKKWCQDGYSITKRRRQQFPTLYKWVLRRCGGVERSGELICFFGLLLVHLLFNHTLGNLFSWNLLFSVYFYFFLKCFAFFTDSKDDFFCDTTGLSNKKL